MVVCCFVISQAHPVPFKKLNFLKPCYFTLSFLQVWRIVSSFFFFFTKTNKRRKRRKQPGEGVSRLLEAVKKQSFMSLRWCDKFVRYESSTAKKELAGRSEGGGGIAAQRVESRVIIQSVMRPSSAKGRVNNVNTILKYVFILRWSKKHWACPWFWPATAQQVTLTRTRRGRHDLLCLSKKHRCGPMQQLASGFARRPCTLC